MHPDTRWFLRQLPVAAVMALWFLLPVLLRDRSQCQLTPVP
jgi:hypothetical protein